ncbi:MAG: hypothetical protein R3F59_23510 [Myxococcota bacterium]
MRDSTDIANREMDLLIADAVARTNARTACEAPPDEVHEALAREIYRATSPPIFVWSRGFFRSAGFSRYSAWLETTEAVDKLSFPRRRDIYGDLTMWNSVILTLAGPCSTFEVGGVRLGSDKFDHFLDVGYHYYRKALRKGDDAALHWGTRTEWSFYGLLTSKVFSYGDMRANWDGWLFYRDLLGPDSIFSLGDDGCVRQDRPFDWRDHVNSEWDEVLNPPVYTRLVERGVLRTLEMRRESVCTSRERWDPGRWWEGYVDDLAVPPYVTGPVPGRRDPWQLAELCDPERTEPLVVYPVRPRAERREERQERRDALQDVADVAGG